MLASIVDSDCRCCCCCCPCEFRVESAYDVWLAAAAAAAAKLAGTILNMAPLIARTYKINQVLSEYRCLFFKK